MPIIPKRSLEQLTWIMIYAPCVPLSLLFCRRVWLPSWLSSLPILLSWPWATPALSVRHRLKMPLIGNSAI